MKNPEPPVGLARAPSVEQCESGVSMEAARQAFKAPLEHKDWFPDPAKSGHVWSETPMETALCPADWRWAIGTRRGRVEVVGFHGWRWKSTRYGRKETPVFVSRCQCGAFQLITGFSLHTHDNGTHACCRCSWHEAVRWRLANKPHWKGRRTGEVLPDEPKP